MSAGSKEQQKAALRARMAALQAQITTLKDAPADPPPFAAAQSHAVHQRTAAVAVTAEGGLGSEEAKDKAARKREQKLEEWRVSALRDPDAQNNANFQPLQFDWRARLKRTRAESEDGKPDQREAAKRGDSVEASLAELQEGLPSGWRVFHDPSSDDFYYGHVVTREARWTRPKK